jgi:hypothetical protein
MGNNVVLESSKILMTQNYQGNEYFLVPIKMNSNTNQKSSLAILKKGFINTITLTLN